MKVGEKVPYFLPINKIENYIDFNRYSKVFILCDTNTKEHCLPLLYEQNKYLSKNSIPIFIKAGEVSKTIISCEFIWKEFLVNSADRKSLLINLGGGMISDIGGFVASTFKRGIDFINIPTTLLAMVDASHGGKTGVNFDGLKNQIGVFSFPLFTWIDVDFLKTLNKKEINCGIAEGIKHILISGEISQDNLSQINLDFIRNNLKKIINVKARIVSEDFDEQNIRKKLNYGHTIAHAIEAIKPNILHGEAVAIGIIIENIIAINKGILPEEIAKAIENLIFNIFSKIAITDLDINNMITAMSNDKKNENGEIYFSLLQSIGNVVINQKANVDEIINAIIKYQAIEN